VIANSNNTVIATIPLENQPQAIGYDSGKEKIFVAYSESHKVSVLSVSSLPSPSPSIPECPLFTVISFLLVTIFLTAILYRVKHQIETRAHKQQTRANSRVPRQGDKS
jgi:hypothetical protein